MMTMVQIMMPIMRTRMKMMLVIVICSATTDNTFLPQWSDELWQGDSSPRVAAIAGDNQPLKWHYNNPSWLKWLIRHSHYKTNNQSLHSRWYKQSEGSDWWRFWIGNHECHPLLTYGVPGLTDATQAHTTWGARSQLYQQLHQLSNMDQPWSYPLLLCYPLLST